MQSKKLLLVGMLAVVAALFGVVSSAEAAVKLKYPKGTILREVGSPDLYYYAADGKKYLFPNMVTYRTWFSDLGRVKDITTKEFKAVSLGTKIVTVRPGVKPIMFIGIDKNFVVGAGNTLREVRDEAIMKSFYGESWKKKIAKLPAEDIINYEIGRFVSSTIDYSPKAQKKYASTINKILPEIISPNKVVVNNKPTAEEKRLPILRSLRENLAASFQPGFKTDKTGYSLSAAPNEGSIQLTPVPANPNSKVYINNWPVKVGYGFRSYLNVGANDFSIKVVLPDKNEMTYNVLVNRQNPESENRLKSLSENLSGAISPKFSSDQQYYTLHAAYGEQILRLAPSAKSKKAKVYIRGEEIKPGKSYAINLATDKTIVDIYVMGQDEALRKYTLEVVRDLYPNLSESRLKSLTVGVGKIFFDSASSDYYLVVPSTKTKTTISAVPINANAVVKIDGEVSRSRTIDLNPGDNQIRISITSPNGYSSLYTVHIQKEVEVVQ